MSDEDRNCILIAWEAGYLSEGQAAKLMDLDRIGLRIMRDEAIEHAERLWKNRQKKESVKDQGGLSG